MKVGSVSGITEFHARLFSTTETGGLFAALRKLAQLESPRQLSEIEEPMDGWYAWYDGGEEESMTPALAPQPA